LQRFNFIKAVTRITYRLLSCNPINARRMQENKNIKNNYG
jgi:putative component of membrane protein insertase Oxa1/YidC/SpoIIIJ protein YidD